MRTNEFKKWQTKAIEKGEFIFDLTDLEKAWNARGEADVKKLQKYFNSHLKAHIGDKTECSLTIGMGLAISILKER